jgi:hypothetical protein
MTKVPILSIFLCVLACTSYRGEPLRNTIYKMGFKTDSSSTGPLNNSAFILKINDTLPPLLLTAHHTVAGIGNNQYVKWHEVESNQKNAWAWSMHDSTFNFKIERNLPIRDAETLKLDIAAFRVPSDLPYLRPAKRIAQIGDTTYLFSKWQYNFRY